LTIAGYGKGGAVMVTRAEWTNALPSVGSSAITVGVKRDFGAITDYFPVQDSPNGAGRPLEGVSVYPQTWYDRYIQRRKGEFYRARLATPYGSAENKRLWAYIAHLISVQGRIDRRKWERGEVREWHSFVDGKTYPDEETAREAQQPSQADPQALKRAIFAQVLEQRRELYNNPVYSRIYTPEKREAYALQEAGKAIAE